MEFSIILYPFKSIFHYPLLMWNKSIRLNLSRKSKNTLKKKNIRDDQRLLIVDDALRGRASVWYEARLSLFGGFGHFKTIFLN